MIQLLNANFFRNGMQISRSCQKDLVPELKDCEQIGEPTIQKAHLFTSLSLFL